MSSGESIEFDLIEDYFKRGFRNLAHEDQVDILCDLLMIAFDGMDFEAWMILVDKWKEYIEKKVNG